jgi:hypothetical protein
MDPLEARVLELLHARRGPAQAVTVAALRQQLAASERAIRRAIAALVVTHRVPIASSVHPPYGFFLLTSAAEARACLGQYGSRVRTVAARARVLAEVVRERFGVDVQLELPFDGPADPPAA